MPVGAYGGRARTDAADRAERPDLPGRHAERQSGGDGGGPGDARTDPGAGLPRRTRSDARTRCATASKPPRAKPASPFTTNRVGAMFGLFFSAEQVDTYAQAIACDTAAFNRFFHAMLERGVYLAPSAFEAGFLSSAHGDAEIAATIDAARAAFRESAARAMPRAVAGAVRPRRRARRLRPRSAAWSTLGAAHRPRRRKRCSPRCSTAAWNPATTPA